MKLLVLLFGMMMVSGTAFADCPTATMGTRPEGHVFHNADYNVHQVCLNNEWQALGPIKCPAGDGCDPCHPTNSPSPGTTCSDGSIYAGLSPDGNVAMFTTQSNEPGFYSWNDGTLSPTPDTAMENCTTSEPSCDSGEANTEFLVNATGETDYPYVAAERCAGLSRHGHNDWHLPALNELNVLYTNKNEGDLNGTFLTSRSYWTSSELNEDFARNQRFTDGAQNVLADKRLENYVRCVRRVP